MAHPDLARAIAAAGRFSTVAVDVTRFPDGELHVAVDEGVAGAHVRLVQPTGAPADRHLLELLLSVDACRRAGARTITAVVPYFGYRPLKPTQPRRSDALDALARDVRDGRLHTVDDRAKANGDEGELARLSAAPDRAPVIAGRGVGASGRGA